VEPASSPPRRVSTQVVRAPRRPAAIGGGGGGALVARLLVMHVWRGTLTHVHPNMMPPRACVHAYYVQLRNQLDLRVFRARACAAGLWDDFDQSWLRFRRFWKAQCMPCSRVWIRV
jgi:hypothetical protein